jgi:hypothetical protein
MNRFLANRIEIEAMEIASKIFDPTPTSSPSKIGDRSNKMRNVMLKAIQKEAFKDSF